MMLRIMQTCIICHIIHKPTDNCVFRGCMILANKANGITIIPWFCSSEVLFDSFLQEHFTMVH